MEVAWVPYGFHGEYFDKYGRKEPFTQSHNPFSFGFGTPEKTVWEIMHEDPIRMQHFMQSMNTIEQHLPISGIYDFAPILKKGEEEPERTLFVDVGGGKGQAIRVLAKDSHLPLEKCVLQDRPEVIEEVGKQDLPDLKGAKLMPHNFHQAQPVKGELT
jgi:O-methyltransferase domain